MNHASQKQNPLQAQRQGHTALPDNTSTTSGGLGKLSSKYESSGNPGTIARNKGDLGGASYGTYQLTTTSGHAQKFASAYGGALKGLKAGTSAFDKAWKQEASKNPTKFAQAQHSYIEKAHYTPAKNAFEKVTGINVSSLPGTVADVIWSIGVQHGSGGASNLFKNAGIKSGMNATQIVTKLYNERMKVNKYFSSSPQAIKNSVLNRFKRELKDALAMLGKK